MPLEDRIFQFRRNQVLYLLRKRYFISVFCGIGSCRAVPPKKGRGEGSIGDSSCILVHAKRGSVSLASQMLRRERERRQRRGFDKSEDNNNVVVNCSLFHCSTCWLGSNQTTAPAVALVILRNLECATTLSRSRKQHRTRYHSGGGLPLPAVSREAKS